MFGISFASLKNMDWFSWLLAAGLLVAIVLLTFVMWNFDILSQAMWVESMNNMRGGGSGTAGEAQGASAAGGGGGAPKTAELMLFFATWCPHCKTTMPIWKDLKSEMDGELFHGYKLVFTEHDCTNADGDNSDTSSAQHLMMDKYGVEAFPTIKLLKGDELIEYDAELSKDTLLTFLDKTLG